MNTAPRPRHPEDAAPPDEQDTARPEVRFADRGEDCSTLERTFRELADEWLLETGGSSLIRKKIQHPAHSKIIGLGPAVVPLLLGELKSEPDYWFWALHCITGQSPVRPGANFDETVADWLAWGRGKGLID